MRAVDRSNAAALLLCLLGNLVPKAVTKTLGGDTATQGKGTFPVFVLRRCSVVVQANAGAAR